MAGKQAAADEAPPKPPTKPPAPKRFEAPSMDLTEYGATTQHEDFVAGVVPSSKVRELLDLFGLQDRTEVVFPFQHIKRMHGEIWRMRIEPSTDHVILGTHVYGHDFAFMRDYPERTAGVE